MPGEIEKARIVFLFEAMRHGSVRGAADALNVAPSAVSRQIALLEEELSIPLLERHTRGVKPTEAGQLLLAYFREQRSHQHDLLSHLQELRGLRSGKIRIALGEGFLPDLMNGVLARFCQDYPKISITLDVGGTDKVVHWVVEDDVDIGVAFKSAAGIRHCFAGIPQAPGTSHCLSGFPLVGQAGAVQAGGLSGISTGAQLPFLWDEAEILMLVEQTEKIRMTPILTTNSFFPCGSSSNCAWGSASCQPVSWRMNSPPANCLPCLSSMPFWKMPKHTSSNARGRQLSFAADRMMQYIATSGMDSLRRFFCGQRSR